MLLPLAKKLSVIVKRSSCGMDALNAFFVIIIGFISSNKWSNRFGGMRTTP